MVAVEDLDPPEEAKIKSKPKGVPSSAPLTEALAERAGARGTSADVLREEGYGEAEASRTQSIAREHFFGDFLRCCLG